MGQFGEEDSSVDPRRAPRDDRRFRDCCKRVCLRIPNDRCRQICASSVRRLPNDPFYRYRSSARNQRLGDAAAKELRRAITRSSAMPSLARKDRNQTHGRWHHGRVRLHFPSSCLRHCYPASIHDAGSGAVASGPNNCVSALVLTQANQSPRRSSLGHCRRSRRPPERHGPGGRDPGVGRSTATRRGQGLPFNDRGEHALKGFEDPVRVFEVRWRNTDKLAA